MSKTVPLRDLSRRERRQLEEDSATLAEEIAAAVYGFTHRPDDAEWYDGVLESTGAKYEVKSTHSEIGDTYSANGRFRLRRDQLRSLRASDASGVAWVVFVLYDHDNGVVRLRRMKPATVQRTLVDGWNDAGHTEFQKQHKVPFGQVFDR